MPDLVIRPAVQDDIEVLWNCLAMAAYEPDAKAAAEQAKLLPVTPWGRYLKILLSNNEFLYLD